MCLYLSNITIQIQAVMRTALEQPDNQPITAVPVISRLTEQQGRFYYCSSSYKL